MTSLRALAFVAFFALFGATAEAAKANADAAFCNSVLARVKNGKQCTTYTVDAQCTMKTLRSYCQGVFKGQTAKRKAWTSKRLTCVRRTTCPSACVALANYAQDTQISVPSAIQAKFGCQLLTGTSGIPAQNICGWLQKKTKAEVCDGLGIIQPTLGELSNVAATRSCKNSQVASTNNPSPLADLRPLPATLTVASVTPEGPTFYWLFRNIMNLYQYTHCYFTNSSNPHFEPPAGWETLDMLNLQQKTGNWPFTAIIMNPTTKEMAVIIRGTTTGYEWEVDFSYNQTSAENSIFGSNTHYGFTSVFQKIWSTVSSEISTHVGNGDVKHIYVTGHSLGAGVATLVGYAAQQQVGSSVTVDTVLFAPPNVGSSAFTDSFNKLVNGRRIAYVTDVVPQVPCSPDMAGCAPVLGIPPEFPTKTNQKPSWPYAQVGASIILPASAMPQDAASWAKLTVVPDRNAGNAGSFVSATHICSYHCWTSQFAGAIVPSECWLVKGTNTPATASFCAGFPKKNGYPA